MTDTLTAAAELLARAAATGERPADLPGDLVPADAAAAYRVQDLVVAGRPVLGWKIAATAADGAHSCAPMVLRIEDGGSLPAGGALPELEVEIAIEVIRDLPPRDGAYAADEVDAALGQAAAAIEVLGSRYAVRKAVGPLSGLADAQSNAGFVIGAERADWRSREIADCVASLSDGSAEIGGTNAGGSSARTLAALVWLANHAQARGGLKAGQWVITGARRGPVEIAGPATLTAGVSGIGTATLVIPAR
ncbi:hypothetical protein V8J36_12615 [Frigidibacter sp. MR17.14]|uniref:hypothetical protein n=1 Tax=Frigidibacter sp. MR17.14 TaxID=3126509 RepID=UPI003012A597